MGPRSEAVVLWTRGIAGTDPLPGGGPIALLASAVQPGTSSFGPGEVISNGDGQVGADAAIDPSSSRTAAVWGSFSPASAKYAVRQPIEAP
jgi:hypothetical protein